MIRRNGGAVAEATTLSEAQKRYLARGISQPGGKLPLFDELGQKIPEDTIRACLRHGWAAPWYRNPLKPDWLVCRLTDAGRRALADLPVEENDEPELLDAISEMVAEPVQ